MNNLSPMEFLQSYYGCDDCSVSYRPYEGSRLIKTMSMEAAAEKIEQDIQEITELFQSFDIDTDKAPEATYNNWKKMLVRFD